jgi:LysM repeat protein
MRARALAAREAGPGAAKAAAPARTGPVGGTVARAAPARTGDVKRVEPVLEEVARVLAGVDYQVGEGDTVLTVAKRFGSSAQALVRANELRTQQLLTGQRLKVPRPAGCTLNVPSSPEAQMLAGAIFAEASPRRSPTTSARRSPGPSPTRRGTSSGSATASWSARTSRRRAGRSSATGTASRSA